MEAHAKWNSISAERAKSRLSLKKLNWLGLACVLALATSGYVYYWWTVGRYFQGTDDAYVGGDVTPISPHISGFIAQIEVVDNQLVKAGQLLVRLDDRDMRAAVAHAEAVLGQRQATLASLQAQYVLQQSTIVQANADIDAKSAEAAFAKIDAERYRSAPSINLGLGSLPPERLKYASGLFNMMRNLGGAVGIAICGAILNARTNFHFLAIASNLTPANGAMQRMLADLTQRYGMLPGSLQAGHVAALKQLWELAYREASTLAYADAFRVIMVAFVVATLLVPLMRNVAVPPAPPAEAH
jgi:hypothetical protein